MRVRTTLLAACLAALAGCGPQIQEADDVRVAAPGGLERLVFGEYWEAQGFPGSGTPPARVAIASLRVEMVEERLTAPDKYGMSQFKTVWGVTQDRLPGQLYEMAVARFTEHGREVVPLAQTAASPSYANYPRRSGPEVVGFDRPIESMAGKIRQIRVKTVAGLALVEGDAAAIAATDAALAKELGVDAVVHLTLRVGVWNGRGTIEEGCVVGISIGDSSAKLKSRRTLASSGSILRSRQYTANISGEFHVEPERYTAAITEVFPPYIGLAAEAIRK